MSNNSLPAKVNPFALGVLVVASAAAGYTLWAIMSADKGGSDTPTDRESRPRVPSPTTNDLIYDPAESSTERVAAKVAESIVKATQREGYSTDDSQEIARRSKAYLNVMLRPKADGLRSFAHKHGASFNQDVLDQISPAAFENRAKLLEGVRLGDAWIEPFDNSSGPAAFRERLPNTMMVMLGNGGTPVSYAYNEMLSDTQADAIRVMIPAEVRTGVDADKLTPATIGIILFKPTESRTGWKIGATQLFIDVGSPRDREFATLIPII